MMSRFASASPEGSCSPPAPRLPILRVFGEPRFHADGELTALAFNCRGELWSVEEPGILRQWQLSNGQRLQERFLSDLETLWVFSPDGQLLASASDDLTLWEVALGRAIATIAQPSWVTTLAFHPRLTWIATGHDDGSVRLWDTANRQLVREWAAHQRPISALSFSPTGDCLASAGEDRCIHLWKPAAGQLLRTLMGHPDRIPALAWHPQGKLLVSVGWDTTARVWSVDHDEPVILLNSHADQVNLVAFSPDGQLLACADSENTIHLWNTESWQTQRLLTLHENEIRCLTFSPDGQTLVSGGAKQVLHVWDVQRGQLVAGSNTPSRHTVSIVASSYGARLVSNCSGTGLRVWDLTTCKSLATEELPGSLAVASSPDGRWLFRGGLDTRIQLWQAANVQPFLSLMGQRGPVVALAVAPAGDLLASASASDGTVWLWNLVTGEPALLIIEAADGCTVETVAFHPDGQRLACGGIDWLATGGSDGAICLWDVRQPSKLAVFEHGTTCLAFHPSGRWLAAASLDEAGLVWDVNTQRLHAELAGHQDNLTSLTYSPDGRWLVTASEDHTLRLWHADTLRPAAVHELDTPVQSLCFSADGRYLFTGNANTTCFQLELARLLDE